MCAVCNCMYAHVSVCVLVYVGLCVCTPLYTSVSGCVCLCVMLGALCQVQKQWLWNSIAIDISSGILNIDIYYVLALS